MKFQRLAAVSALVIGAMTAGMTVVHADPAAAPAPIRYSVKLVDKTVVTNLQGGTFRLSDDHKSYDIADSRGATVVSLPAEFEFAGVKIPLTSAIEHDGAMLKLTPERTFDEADRAAAVQAAAGEPIAVKPVASAMENARALSDFKTNFGIATAIGTFLGTVVGVIAGGITGCLLGLPIFGVTCLPAAVAGAGIGGVLGTILVGGPALAITAFDVIGTLSAAPGTTKWADDKDDKKYDK
ncbi:hypothetical protein [Nocardia vermiculata]|uniref:DUF8020 domain-containing protein n=1 Tax=Nocardia vermiculata TaxID=257274 RepID=A0A846XZM5_9NOCA|nr:hypothetical protein [Nocardia vermiculata]NKY52503.1 hypothetical protein [Nocardia vermiculata]